MITGWSEFPQGRSPQPDLSTADALAGSVDGLLQQAPVMAKIPAAAQHLALAQDGMVTWAQLRSTGVGHSTIATLVRSGRWQRRRPGIYFILGGRPSDRALVWEAILEAGEGAVAVGRTALWLASCKGPLPRPIDIAIPSHRYRPQRPGVRVRRIDVVAFHGSPPRTAPDVALLEAVHRTDRSADVLNLVFATVGDRLCAPERLMCQLALRKRQRWRALLVQLLGRVECGVRSPLELADHDNDRAHGLPVGSRQVSLRVAGVPMWVDVLTVVPETGQVLVTELDGRLGHQGTGRFRDMRRDNHIVLLNGTPLRFGWTDVVVEPCTTAATKVFVLRRLGWTGTPKACGSRCTLRASLGALSADYAVA